jgi:hypothetical protein
LRFLGDPCGRPELPGRDADKAFEVLAALALAREAGAGDDLGQGQVSCCLQEMFGPLDAAQKDLLVRRRSGVGIAMLREAVAVVRDCGPLRQGKAG